MEGDVIFNESPTTEYLSSEPTTWITNDRNVKFTSDVVANVIFEKSNSMTSLVSDVNLQSLNARSLTLFYHSELEAQVQI